MYSITKNNLHVLLDRLTAHYRVYAPVRKGGSSSYARYPQESGAEYVFGEVRAVDPLKAFVFRPREVVAEGFCVEAPVSDDKPTCIVGVKACDLKGFRVQDHVFGGNGNGDPFYARARESSLIISSDCTSAIDTCFCLALHVEPHPLDSFDLNLSLLDGDFVVDVGSEKGDRLVSAHGQLFTKATHEMLALRDAQRERVRSAVEDNLACHGVPDQDALEGKVGLLFNDPLWEEEARACVECGACNVVCPTCHCFYLYDQAHGDRMTRFRTWDSCMLKDFARVAGGGNPRPKLWMRLRNRFEKKFDFFPKVAGVYACTGCGRCISACPAKIDIRRVMKRLVGNA